MPGTKNSLQMMVSTMKNGGTSAMTCRSRAAGQRGVPATTHMEKNWEPPP
jgi:hypothetical protein